MKKQVGILTFHSSNNFGALLQTYGTFFIVDKLGETPSIINYHCPHKKNGYKAFYWSKDRTLKKNLIAIANAPLKHSKNRKSESFRQDTLNIKTKELTTYEEMRTEQNKYLKIIVGSDQIWNYLNTGFDKRYFLDFVEEPNKKIAYAASFAISNIEEKYKKDYANLLNQISYISVREEQGCKIVQELTGKDVPQTLDPTFLLTKEEWNSFAISESTKTIGNDYLLIYSIGNDKRTIKLARKIATELNLKIIIIGNRFQEYLMSGVKTVNPSIHEFVKLFRDASYIVTSSFHGVAFSAIFNKEFICSLDRDSPGNSRQLSLLEMIGLSNRIAYNSMDSQQVNVEIDWDNVNKILEYEREKSVKFLKNALSG